MRAVLTIHLLTAVAIGAGLESCALVVRPGVGTPDAATFDVLPADRVAVDGVAAAADAAQESGLLDDADTSDVPPIVVTSGCYPPCLADVFRPCIGAGPCVNDSSGGPNLTCYANGVVWSTTLDSDHEFASNRASRDGQVCWSINYARSTLPGTSIDEEVLTVLDGTGRVVGTMTDVGHSALLTAACDGQRYVVDTQSTDCRAFHMPEGCRLGTCMH